MSGIGRLRRPDELTIMERGRFNGRVDRSSSNLARLHARLRQLYRELGGPPYRELSECADREGLKLARTTIGDLLTSSRRPRWTTVEVFVMVGSKYAAGRRTPLDISAQLSDLTIWRRLYEALDVDDDWGPSQQTIRATAPVRRSRRALGRADEWDVCVNFLLVLDAAQNALRDVARAKSHFPSRYLAANRAVDDAGVYAERERVLVTGAPDVVKAADDVFLRLADLRNAVRAGATLESADYHRTYHPFAAAMWCYRMAIRAEFGREPLVPTELGRDNWLDHERCVECPLTPDAASGISDDEV
jgi:hypothetical protein